MATIEIDFDVFKELTLRREYESVTYNDVLRQILGLGEGGPEKAPATASASKGCVMQGIHFPEGTEFRVTYKGRTYTASIKGGRWVGDDGQVRRSPSDAATWITRNNVNGWRFWSFKRPEDHVWQKLQALQAS